MWTGPAFRRFRLTSFGSGFSSKTRTFSFPHYLAKPSTIRSFVSFFLWDFPLLLFWNSIHQLSKTHTLWFAVPWLVSAANPQSRETLRLSFLAIQFCKGLPSRVPLYWFPGWLFSCSSRVNPVNYLLLYLISLPASSFSSTFPVPRSYRRRPTVSLTCQLLELGPPSPAIRSS